MSDFDLGGIQGSSSGLDAFFENDSTLVTPQQVPQSPLQMTPPKTASKPRMRTRVASLHDLHGFVRVAEDQLINKATQDLWSLQKDADGSFFIERMFDEAKAPLKG